MRATGGAALKCCNIRAFGDRSGPLRPPGDELVTGSVTEVARRAISVQNCGAANLGRSRLSGRPEPAAGRIAWQDCPPHRTASGPQPAPFLRQHDGIRRVARIVLYTDRADRSDVVRHKWL